MSDKFTGEPHSSPASFVSEKATSQPIMLRLSYPTERRSNVMAYSAGATAAVAAQAALVQATRASGVIVRLEPEAFVKIIDKNRSSVVVHSISGIRKKAYNYLTSYKGLAFYTKSETELVLPKDIELIFSKQIWIPE